MIPLWVVSGAVAAAAAFGSAWQIQGWRADAAAHAREINARAEERLRRQNTDTAAVAYEKGRTEIETVYVPIKQEIERVVEKVVYRDRICFDDDGVHAANRALRGLAPDPSEPGGTVPAAADAHGRPRGDGAAALR